MANWDNILFCDIFIEKQHKLGFQKSSLWGYSTIMVLIHAHPQSMRSYGSACCYCHSAMNYVIIVWLKVTTRHCKLNNIIQGKVQIYLWFPWLVSFMFMWITRYLSFRRLFNFYRFTSLQNRHSLHYLRFKRKRKKILNLWYQNGFFAILCLGREVGCSSNWGKIMIWN